MTQQGDSRPTREPVDRPAGSVGAAAFFKRFVPTARVRNRYWPVVAIVVVAAATGFRLTALPALGTRNVYVTFYPAVVLAALYGGLRAGLLATVLSALVADYFWIPPLGTWLVSDIGKVDAADWLGLGVFFVGGIMISAVTEAMHRAQQKVRAVSGYVRSLLEASLDPLVAISPTGKITDVNQATKMVTGLPAGRLIGSDFSDYFVERERAEAGYQLVLRAGFVRDYPLTIRHASGRTTDVLYNATVYRNDSGAMQGVFAAARDVTQRNFAEAELTRYRNHLEELVRLRTGELEAANGQLQAEIAERQRAAESLRRTTEELKRSNQELEQFAYVASHDLQEPLRAVAGYLGLIEQRLDGVLDDKSRQHLQGAIQGASRMHTLITDLLALSRVGTRGGAFGLTDLDAVLDQALQSANDGIQSAGATIVRTHLPTLWADHGQMIQLFQNLVGNAIKFCGEQPPEIHIEALRQEDGRWRFAVRDNGIGIEPQYFERIFLIFQRLHTRREYPGNGIGLAICKKIVERHGGKIWVDSTPSGGSTFYFTISDQPAS